MHKMKNTNSNQVLTTWTHSANISDQARHVKTYHYEPSLKSPILVDLHSTGVWLHSRLQWHLYNMWGRNELKWNVIGHVKCQRTVPTGYIVSKWVLMGKFNAKWVGNLMGMFSTYATSAGYDQNIVSWTTLKIADFKQYTEGVFLARQSSYSSCAHAILKVWQQMNFKLLG